MDKKITSLKVQKKDPSRINVYLDDSFAFGISRIVGAWLQVGQVLDEEKISQLLEDDQKEKAYQKALRFIQYRYRSEKEINDKLKEADFSDQLISEIIQRLKENQLCGDLDFARMWVENRCSLRPRSHRLLRMELRQKGIDENIIDKVLTNSPQDDELAKALAEKYLSRLHGYDWQDFQKRLSGYLVRKGFDYSVTREVVQDIWNAVQASKK
jgi:regulatory protein